MPFWITSCFQVYPSPKFMFNAGKKQSYLFATKRQYISPPTHPIYTPYYDDNYPTTHAYTEPILVYVLRAIFQQVSPHKNSISPDSRWTQVLLIQRFDHNSIVNTTAKFEWRETVSFSDIYYIDEGPKYFPIRDSLFFDLKNKKFSEISTYVYLSIEQIFFDNLAW